MSSAPPTYPSFSDAALVPFRAIQAQVAAHPDILDRDDCPYPDHIRSFLRPLLGVAGPGPGERVRYDDDDLYQEIVDLYEDVKAATTAINTNDAKDKVQILKNSTDLLTRLVALREKQLNIRQMGQFQKAVVEFMEGTLTPAQRAEFIEKLGQYANV